MKALPPKSPIHLVIPMSGRGTRFRKAGYPQSKPMVPVSGIPMISRLLTNFPIQWPAHFVLADFHRGTDLPLLLKNERPNSDILYIPEHSLGPSHAVLACLENIPEDDPVLVSYCDYGMVWDSAQFESFVHDSNCDACLISYRGFHAHYLRSTNFAYSKLQGDSVVEVKEKGHFTQEVENEFASAGGYYFKSARILRKSIEFQISNGLQLNGEFYTSLTVQSLILSDPDANVRIFEIPGFFQWGTPEDLRAFEYWEKCFRSEIKKKSIKLEVSQLLMPMAGLGSRFSKVTKLPKPLIPINGIPMYQTALNSLPTAQSTILVTLDKIAEKLPSHPVSSDYHNNLKVVSTKKTPSGQALSTKLGIHLLEMDQEVLISSCDHSVILDQEIWTKFRSAPQCEAAIFTVKGFPGASEQSNAFTFVEVTPNKGTTRPLFPEVQRVSVKNPVSNKPLEDHLLIGTFWFRSGAILKAALQKLMTKDLRFNNELYLDSIFEIMMESRQVVRVIEVNGYINWGDPASLCEALYWKEIFGGHKIEIRPPFPGVSWNA